MPYLIEFSFLTFLPSLPQPDLTVQVRLQVIVNHLKVLEGGKHRIVRQGPLDEELELPRVLEQSVPGVDAHFLTDGAYHAPHFPLEVRRVVDDVEIRVANPRRRRVAVKFFGQFHAL